MSKHWHYDRYYERFGTAESKAQARRLRLQAREANVIIGLTLFVLFAPIVCLLALAVHIAL